MYQIFPLFLPKAPSVQAITFLNLPGPMISYYSEELVSAKFTAMAYLPRIFSDPPRVGLPGRLLHQEAQHRISSASAECMTQHGKTSLFFFFLFQGGQLFCKTHIC